ncbi:uncharacterized protein [Nicotiana sylvestris]|uniref:uncharacterized protein n=1 Tax=Nicotiana sylvestris TaxID=4096 RepID=UPI00388C6C73
MPALPFPQKMKREKLDKYFGRFMEMLKKLYVNIPFTEVLTQMSAYAKFLREILSSKRKLEETTVAKLNAHCNAILQNKILQKCGDLESFTIPCSLGSEKFDKALFDSSASINLMPLSVFRKLEGELEVIKSIPVYLQMANQTTIFPEGIIEYILVRVDKAILDIYEGKLELRVGNEQIAFRIKRMMKYRSDEASAYSCFKLDVVGESAEKYKFDKLVGDTLERYTGAKAGGATEKVQKAIGWTTVNIQGISPAICMLKILLEENSKPVVQPQRKLNKNLEERISPVQILPKNVNMTVVKIEDNELIPTRTVTGCRMCIDYRMLNDAARKDHFPLPFIDQMLEKVAGHGCYHFLDGYSVCNQIPISLEDVEKITFTCLSGIFAYRRMPFGFCNALTTFQRCMISIFSDLNRKCLENLELVLERYEATHLVLNWEKCHFMVKEGVVLGYKVTTHGIEVDRDKPLTALLAKDVKFVFTVECLKTFELIKEKLSSPIMVTPDWSQRFEMICDASYVAVGAVLGKRKDKMFRPIYYASRTLNDA